jgi:hypothetical protein
VAWSVSRSCSVSERPERSTRVTRRRRPPRGDRRRAPSPAPSVLLGPQRRPHAVPCAAPGSAVRGPGRHDPPPTCHGPSTVPRGVHDSLVVRSEPPLECSRSRALAPGPQPPPLFVRCAPFGRSGPSGAPADMANARRRLGRLVMANAWARPGRAFRAHGWAMRQVGTPAPELTMRRPDRSRRRPRPPPQIAPGGRRRSRRWRG